MTSNALLRVLLPVARRIIVAPLMFAVTVSGFAAGAAEVLEAPTNFQERSGLQNPLSSESGFQPAALAPYLAFGDLDDDGDVDLVLGETDTDSGSVGVLRFYENLGTANEPDFVLQTEGHPLELPQQTLALANGAFAFPALSDVDLDGDLDLLVGSGVPETNDEGQQYVLFFRNDGSPSTPSFSYVPEPENPFSALAALSGFFDPGMQANPGGGFSTEFRQPALVVVDLNGDSLPDVVNVGLGDDSMIHYFPNLGTAAAPSYGPPRVSEQDGNPYPLEGERHLPGGFSLLTLEDVDLDGDLDTVVGFTPDQGDSALRFFTNEGTPMEPAFTEETETHPVSALNSNDGLAGLIYPQPFFVDVDVDGDLDLFVAGTSNAGQELASQILFFENDGLPNASAAEQSATDLPGQSVEVASDRFAGWVYIAQENVVVETLDDLEAARSAGRAARAPVTAAIEPMDVPTEGIEAGTYFAYAVDGADRVNAAQLANPITITDPSARGEDSSQAWIEQVTIGGVTNASGNDGGYAWFPELTIVGTPGAEITIRIEPGFTSAHGFLVRRLAQQRFGVWLDVNRNTIFEETERLAVAGPTWEPVEATITIPADLEPGDTLGLRVIMQFHELGVPEPAGVIPFGEVEDYVFTVTQ